MTHSNLSLDSLRARVEALGLRYLTNPDTGYVYVADDSTVPFEHPNDENLLVELETWVADRETDKADAAVPKWASEETEADFNAAAGVRETYEKFLELLVLAGLRDRLEAMKLRKAKGVEAALEFLEECTLTPEHEQLVDDTEPATEQRVREIAKPLGWCLANPPDSGFVLYDPHRENHVAEGTLEELVAWLRHKAPTRKIGDAQSCLYGIQALATEHEEMDNTLLSVVEKQAVLGLRALEELEIALKGYAS